MNAEDRATIIVKKNTLKQISDGFISSAEVPMVGFNNYQWALRLYRNPNDTLFQPVLWISPNREEALNTCAYLYINGDNFIPCGQDNNDTEEHRLMDPISINEIGDDGRIKLEIQFGRAGYIRATRPPPAFGPDIRLFIGTTQLPTSRHLLSLLSPVFKSKLQEDSMKAKNAQLVITGYSVRAVRAVIDFINGYPNPENPVEAIKFAVDFKMKSVEDHFTQVVADTISEQNFCDIVESAFELNNTDLKKRCAEFYRNNLALTLKPEFVRLQTDTKEELIHMASQLGN